MADTTRGLYRKYNVTRTDGSSEPHGKHHKCQYFVLDLDHDDFAWAALRAYAKACKRRYPLLAADLQRLVVERNAGIALMEAARG